MRWVNQMVLGNSRAKPNANFKVNHGEIIWYGRATKGAVSLPMEKTLSYCSFVTLKAKEVEEEEEAGNNSCS